MGKKQVVYKNGDEYYGQLSKDNMMEGQGTYKFKDGSKYIGQFANNLFNGQGKLIDKFNDLIIIGQFVRGKAQGIGRILYGGVQNYNAQNQKIEQSAKNSQASTPKGEYQGQIKYGNRNGKGKYQFLYPQSDLKAKKEVVPIFYEGMFKDDAFNGNGKLVFSDKSYYSGDFYENLYNGHGQYHTQQFIYIGNFHKGIIQGKGIIKYPSGQYYEGQFQNTMKHGFGKYYYIDQNQQKKEKPHEYICFYSGQWKNDEKNGKGKINFSNGDSYQGEFLDDQPYGQFKCLIGNMEILAELQGDILNGPIKMIDKNQGIIISGSYKDGIKNGVMLVQKLNKYGQKVTYRGQFKQGKQIPYTISYSHRF